MLCQTGVTELCIEPTRENPAIYRVIPSGARNLLLYGRNKKQIPRAYIALGMAELFGPPQKAAPTNTAQKPYKMSTEKENADSEIGVARKAKVGAQPKRWHERQRYVQERRDAPYGWVLKTVVGLAPLRCAMTLRAFSYSARACGTASTAFCTCGSASSRTLNPSAVP